jgi:hypothetical protein
MAHVRFTTKSGHVRCTCLCPLRANSGHRDKLTLSAIRSVRRRGPEAMARSQFLERVAAILDCRRHFNNDDVNDATSLALVGLVQHGH